MDRPSPAERIGQEACALIDQLEEHYGTDGFNVHTVAIVCELTADGPGGETTLNPIVYRCNDPRSWVQAALLHEAHELAEENNAARIEAADDAG